MNAVRCAHTPENQVAANRSSHIERGSGFVAYKLTSRIVHIDFDYISCSLHRHTRRTKTIALVSRTFSASLVMSPRMLPSRLPVNFPRFTCIISVSECVRCHLELASWFCSASFASHSAFREPTRNYASWFIQASCVRSLCRANESTGEQLLRFDSVHAVSSPQPTQSAHYHCINRCDNGNDSLIEWIINQIFVAVALCSCWRCS